jgi:hypothetical protein
MRSHHPTHCRFGDGSWSLNLLVGSIGPSRHCAVTAPSRSFQSVVLARRGAQIGGKSDPQVLARQAVMGKMRRRDSAFTAALPGHFSSRRAKALLAGCWQLIASLRAQTGGARRRSVSSRRQEPSQHR